MHRRTLLTLPAAALAARAARAETWPARPVRMVVPFPPGGTTDFVARLVGDRLAAVLGQPFVIENRAGAGGTVGSDFVAKSAPDGHTLVVSNVAAHGVAPSVYPTIPYDAVRDFAHVALLAEIPSVLVVNIDSPIRDLAGFIAAAKAKPGGLSVGSPGNGTSSHVKQEILKRAAAIETVHVPYRGSGPMMNDVAAGQIDAMITTLVEAGRNPRFRLLAVTAAERVAGWPQVPTFVELGYPDLVASTWFGLSGPAAMPRDRRAAERRGAGRARRAGDRRAARRARGDAAPAERGGVRALRRRRGRALGQGRARGRDHARLRRV